MAPREVVVFALLVYGDTLNAVVGINCYVDRAVVSRQKLLYRDRSGSCVCRGGGDHFHRFRGKLYSYWAPIEGRLKRH